MMPNSLVHDEKNAYSCAEKRSPKKTQKNCIKFYFYLICFPCAIKQQFIEKCHFNVYHHQEGSQESKGAGDFDSGAVIVLINDANKMITKNSKSGFLQFF